MKLMGADFKPTLLQIRMFLADAIDYNSHQFVVEHLVITYQQPEARNLKAYAHFHTCAIEVVGRLSGQKILS